VIYTLSTIWYWTPLKTSNQFGKTLLRRWHFLLPKGGQTMSPKREVCLFRRTNIDFPSLFPLAQSFPGTAGVAFGEVTRCVLACQYPYRNPATGRDLIAMISMCISNRPMPPSKVKQIFGSAKYAGFTTGNPMDLIRARRASSTPRSGNGTVLRLYPHRPCPPLILHRCAAKMHIR